jgi:hypothetical protein
MRQGYECFLLRIDWPAIEPVAGGIRSDTLQKILSHADAIGLKLIIGLEMDIAPAWFVQRYPEAVSVTRYIDEEIDIRTGKRLRNTLRGRLDFKDGRGIIGFHWPETSYRWEETDLYRDIRVFWEDIVNILKKNLDGHESFVGWALNTPASPLGYAGGGIQGVLGISDYSDARRDTYFKSTNGIETPNPLLRYSQGFPDGRPEWLEFSLFRVTNRRDFIDFVGNEIKIADPYRPVFFFPGEILPYAADNGYLAECEALDWGYFMRRKYIDGVILPFQLSTETFANGFHPGNGELLPLQAAVGAAIRHGKLPLVWIENAPMNPTKADVRAFACLLKVWGAYPLYSQPVRYPDSERWGRTLVKEIEAASFHRLLPPPVKSQPARVAVIDYPFFFAKYYAEKDDIIKTACIQLEIFSQAGIPFDLVDLDEIIENPSVLDDYRVAMPLSGTIMDTELFISPIMQGILSEFRSNKGQLYHPHPIKLKEFAQGGYSDVNLIEETRVEFARLGCGANQVGSSDVTAAVAQPYVFVYPHRHRYDSYLNPYIEGWSSGGSQILYFLEVLSERKLTADVFTYLARMDLDLYGGRPYLYAETSSIMDVLDQVTDWRSMISARQTAQAMRAFVPVSLAVCFIMLLLLAFYSLHGHKERIQQQAIRIGGSQQLEEFDVAELEKIKLRAFIRDLSSPDAMKRIVAAAGLSEMGADATEALQALRSKVHAEEDEYVKKAILDAISKIEGYG